MRDHHQFHPIDFLVIVLILASVAYSVFKLCTYVTSKLKYQPIMDIESQTPSKHVKRPQKARLWYFCNILDKILRCYDIIRVLSLILHHKLPPNIHDEL